MKIVPTVLIALVTRQAPARAAPAPAWTVDKAASSVRFSSAMNGQAFSGAFRRWNADIRFDPKNLAASSVSATFETASAATGDPDRDQALPHGRLPRRREIPHGDLHRPCLQGSGPEATSPWAN